MPFRHFALAAALVAATLALQGCLAAAVVGTTVGVAGAVIGTTGKVAVGAGKAIIPGDGDKDRRDRRE
ncbi:MAG: hypothetical protein JWP92_3385 [Caulobacter sp.]|nr:hypothetical protein [Caulobacter sp.]